jgi:hypothetical protein
MKKRVEKVVECIGNYTYLTIGKKYLVHSESIRSYSVKDDEGDINFWDKEDFKVVSEREVLEFEVGRLFKDREYENNFSLHVYSEIDLKNYNLKVIATPKDSPYEGKSREELIEIIKELKAKE